MGRGCQIGTRKNKIKGISFVMGDFSQNGIISNLHDFGTKTTADIEKELLKFYRHKKVS